MKRLTSDRPLTEFDTMNLSATDLYIKLKAYEDAKEKGAVEMKKEIGDAYKKGVEDAWEAARKIVLVESDGGLSSGELHDIFGSSWGNRILRDTAPLEAIEKIREYEERQFRVGDECHYKINKNNMFVLTRIYVESGNWFFDAVGSDGSLLDDGSCDLIEKTGRHFPQIAEVLGMMGEAMTGE